MDTKWFFSNELSPSDELVDKFADSKFEANKWGSFTREIIQNSLDAYDDENKPVVVKFELSSNLSINDIPGGPQLADIITRCANAASNKQTKLRYTKGIEILSKDNIYCLKISDYNTTGVKTGRDEAWGALVYDEGKSVKQRPGSAGSHGVGKKVPFIISTCNTVFYSTYNKYIVDEKLHNDYLFEGRTTLINWVDSEGVRKNSKGWYGNVDLDADSKNRVKPLDESDYESINPFFLRRNTTGTDVTIVGANMYGKEDEIKSIIISSALENFLVSIVSNKLELDIFGVLINKENYIEIANQYYKEQTDVNNFWDCKTAYFEGDVITKPICNSEGKELGTIDIHFVLGNEHNRKYYTFIRDHGMRISSQRINRAGQPYTALIIINGQELNEKLSSLENAAHDKFIESDDNMEMDKEAVAAIRKIKDEVESCIIEKTAIDSTQGQTIDGLSEIINIPGSLVSIKDLSKSPLIKPNREPHQGRAVKGSGNGEGGTRGGEGSGGSRKKKLKVKPGDSFNATLFNDYVIEPIFFKEDKGYLFKFQVSKSICNAELLVKSINADAKEDDTIANYLDWVEIDGQRRKFSKGKIKGLSLVPEKLYCCRIKTLRDFTYQLTASIFIGGTHE